MEQEYIKGLKLGSYKDFTILYEIYAGRLYAFIFSLTHSESLTKDIVQETFIKVWVKREQIDAELSFKSYLFTIARNQLLNEFRNQVKRPIPTDDAELASHEDMSENVVERKLSLEEFYRCLGVAKTKLTARQRELFELNKEQGLSVSEIVAMTSITEQSVRNQLSLAIRVLRKELGDYYLLLVIIYLC